MAGIERDPLIGQAESLFRALERTPGGFLRVWYGVPPCENPHQTPGERRMWILRRNWEVKFIDSFLQNMEKVGVVSPHQMALRIDRDFERSRIAKARRLKFVDRFEFLDQTSLESVSIRAQDQITQVDKIVTGERGKTRRKLLERKRKAELIVEVIGLSKDLRLKAKKKDFIS